MTIRPLEDRILIKPCEVEEVTPGGILLPQSSQDPEQVTTGVVIATGPGKWHETGYLVAPDVKPDDKVLFRPWGGTEVTVDGVVHRLLQSHEVLAVIEP